MKTLYLRIYVTVLAALLAFALAAGWLANRKVEHERESARAMWSDRAAAWAELLENSLPAASAPTEAQRDALLDWAERLRLPLALDDSRGQRIATSERYTRREQESAFGPPRAPISLTLSDGRVLWLMSPAFGERSGPGRDLRPPPPGEGGGPPHGGGGGGHRGFPPPPPGGAPWLPGGWLASGSGLLAAMAVLFVAVGAGAYPVVRRLTRRLEALRNGVETFGAGDLGHRVDEQGRDEVAAVAASFNQAAERIEALIRANRSLLANASHELRSPLARLKMAVSLMDSASPERAAQLQHEIDEDIRELDALVEEVLMASRLDAQTEIVRERVDLLGLCVEEGARVPRADVDGQSAWVLGDERLLRRAVRNLLENAQRYGGTEAIDVRVDSAKGRARVSVADRGAGVPPDQRERIFEAFYRLPGHAEMSGGVGLGLSLVRQIARRHGGEARCEAREGGGSVFALDLPSAA